MRAAFGQSNTLIDKMKNGNPETTSKPRVLKQHQWKESKVVDRHGVEYDSNIRKCIDMLAKEMHNVPGKIIWDSEDKANRNKSTSELRDDFENALYNSSRDGDPVAPKDRSFNNAINKENMTDSEKNKHKEMHKSNNYQSNIHDMDWAKDQKHNTKREILELYNPQTKPQTAKKSGIKLVNGVIVKEEKKEDK